MSQARLPRTEPSTELITAHKVNHRAAHVAGRALGIFGKVRSHRGVCVWLLCGSFVAFVEVLLSPPRHTAGSKTKPLCVCFSVHCVASRISLHGLCKRHRDRKVAIALVGRECISEVHRSMNITHPPQRL